MRGILFFVLAMLLVGCSPTERIVVRTEKDSSEISVLRGKIKEITSENSALQSDVKMWQERSFSLAEELNKSEMERERLATNEEKTVREWNEEGALIREEISRKTSEMERDLARSEQLISNLEAQNRQMELKHATLQKNYDSVVKQNIELQENASTTIKELKGKKERGENFLAWALLVLTNGAWAWAVVRFRS